ncbi:hypothetical protein NDU88_007756 [Pleurodeles waltl]|uniref:Uncharacterized protein n=1 Tax=Pleurodeles waltl TaxID=8319 RepID=A0AAV7STQ8_PLEWA|nr:hypothetical protein NDU88_007756 [Pleurodeles waltl]
MLNRLKIPVGADSHLPSLDVDLRVRYQLDNEPAVRMGAQTENLKEDCSFAPMSCISRPPGNQSDASKYNTMISSTSSTMEHVNLITGIVSADITRLSQSDPAIVELCPNKNSNLVAIDIELALTVSR